MSVYWKYVCEKPSCFRCVDGNRSWMAIKAEIEAGMGSRKSSSSLDHFDNRTKKRKLMYEESAAVAFYQHETDNGEFRIVELDEFIAQNYALIVQRLPKWIVVNIYNTPKDERPKQTSFSVPKFYLGTCAEGETYHYPMKQPTKKKVKKATGIPMTQLRQITEDEANKKLHGLEDVFTDDKGLFYVKDIQHSKRLF